MPSGFGSYKSHEYEIQTRQSESKMAQIWKMEVKPIWAYGHGIPCCNRCKSDATGDVSTSTTKARGQIAKEIRLSNNDVQPEIDGSCIE